MDKDKKGFSCVLCGTKLESKEALQEHFRKHANKEIDAKGNPKVTSNKNNEKTITPKPENSKIKITCDVCPMEFDTVTLAIQHKFRKHPESSVKHYCPYCGMQFPIKFTRDKHVETHKNMCSTGRFPCGECNEMFYNCQAQTYHFKSTHKRIMSIFKPVPTPPPSKKIKINNANEAQSVYYCYLCGMEYIIKFNLQKHLERSHSEDERNKVPGDLIKCTTCDALFYNKKAYDNHNMYHKPDDLYVTSEEQRLQTVTRVDQDFDIRRVQLVADKFIPLDKPKQRRQQTHKKDETKKQKNVIKSETDDELSPTSSIESSDSEDDIKNKITTIDKKNTTKDDKEVKTELDIKDDNEVENYINTENIDNKSVNSVEKQKNEHKSKAEKSVDIKSDDSSIKVEKINDEIRIVKVESEVSKDSDEEPVRITRSRNKITDKKGKKRSFEN